MTHDVVKPEKIVAIGVAALEEKLVLPKVMHLKGIDEYKGAKDDTINETVEGVLPYRSYGWRNDRSTAVVFDDYAERKVALTFGGDTYNGVKLTDEQNEMDLPGWTKLAAKQADAVAFGLNAKAVNAVDAAPFEVLVTIDEADVKGSLIKLRSVFNKLRVQGRRSVVVGSDLEAALLSDDKLSLAQNVGDAEAVSALREATLGRRFGFDFVAASEVDAATGYAMVDSAFVFLNAAPGVPQSVPFGARASQDGFQLRWIRDYDTDRQQDRSLFTTWQTFQYVNDPLVGKNGSDQAFVSTANHFVRAVKVELGAAYAVEIGNSELATITGITSTDGTNDGA